MKNLTILLSLGLSAAAFAAHSTTVDDDVNSFAAQGPRHGDARDSRELRHHRAPSLATPSDSKEVDDAFETGKHHDKGARWHDNSSWEFEIVDGKPSEKVQNLLQKRLRHLGLVRESYDSLTQEWILKGAEPQAGTVPVDTLVGKGIQIARQSLRGLGSHIEFQNHEAQTRNTGSSLSVDFVKLRFQRLFHGGVVGGNTSYAYLVLDGTGAPVEFRTRWPEFKPFREVSGTVSAPDALASAKAQCDSTSQISVLGGDADAGKVASSRILRSFLSWHEVSDADGRPLISPAFSFRVQWKFATGDSTSQTVDVPQQRKYWTR